jgi:hypothetical protein
MAVGGVWGQGRRGLGLAQPWLANPFQARQDEA